MLILFTFLQLFNGFYSAINFSYNIFPLCITLWIYVSPLISFLQSCLLLLNSHCVDATSIMVMCVTKWTKCCCCLHHYHYHCDCYNWKSQLQVNRVSEKEEAGVTTSMLMAFIFAAWVATLTVNTMNFFFWDRYYTVFIFVVKCFELSFDIGVKHIN